MTLSLSLTTCVFLLLLGCGCSNASSPYEVIVHLEGDPIEMTGALNNEDLHYRLESIAKTVSSQNLFEAQAVRSLLMWGYISEAHYVGNRFFRNSGNPWLVEQISISSSFIGTPVSKDVVEFARSIAGFYKFNPNRKITLEEIESFISDGDLLPLGNITKNLLAIKNSAIEDHLVYFDEFYENYVSKKCIINETADILGWKKDVDPKVSNSAMVNVSMIALIVSKEHRNREKFEDWKVRLTFWLDVYSRFNHSDWADSMKSQIEQSHLDGNIPEFLVVL